MKKGLFRALFPALLTAFFLTFVPTFLYAGFGISPPYVRNESLTRNSEYEQDITIVRSDPDTDQKALISIDVPGANEWFTVDKGKEFLLPKGEQKVSMIVRVRIPNDAKFQQYKGNMRIRTTAVDEGDRSAGGSVSIALGAQIDVDLTIVDKKIYDFRVRKISIGDLNEGHTLGWLYFPGKIKFSMDIENTGNVSSAPSKVVFAIYDSKGTELLETTENLNRIKKVNPFETKQVMAEIPTRLKAGSYVVRYKILGYEEAVKQEGELSLSILSYGTIPGDNGFGFTGLSLGDKASLVTPVMLAASAFVVLRASKKKKRR